MTSTRLAPLYTSDSDEWYTPAPFVQALAELFANGAFTLDAAATAASAKAPKHYDIDTDALTQDWHADAAGGVVWCNMPYSNVKGFLKKAWETSLAGTTVVVLLPARTDTIAWHEYAMRAAEVYLVRGRISFERPNGDASQAATFPSAVLVFRPGVTCPPVFAAMLRDGTISCARCDDGRCAAHRRGTAAAADAPATGVPMNNARIETAPRLTTDTRETAQLLGISYSTMQKLCARRAWNAHELPRPIRIGGKRLWLEDHVRTFLYDKAAA